MFQRRRAPRDPLFVLLLAQLAQQVLQLEHKPPVTLALMAANLALFFGGPDLLPPHLHPSVWGCCLQPQRILERHEWWRLLISAFLHADESHVYYNMSSLLWKGVQLEARYGPLVFAALVVELLLLSHAVTVLLAAWLAAGIPEYGYLYSHSCAVGFSAVLFALKVVLQHNAEGFSHVLGIPLPTKYLAWAELFLASYFNPSASFLGHLGGILAGLLHVKVLVPHVGRMPGAMRLWRRRVVPGVGSGRRTFQSGGRLGAGASGGEGRRGDGGQPVASSGGPVPGLRARTGLGAAAAAATGPRNGGGGGYVSAATDRSVREGQYGRQPEIQPAGEELRGSSRDGGGEARAARGQVAATAVADSGSAETLSLEELRQRRLARLDRT